MPKKPTPRPNCVKETEPSCGHKRKYWLPNDRLAFTDCKAKCFPKLAQLRNEVQDLRAEAQRLRAQRS